MLLVIFSLYNCYTPIFIKHILTEMPHFCIAFAALLHCFCRTSALCLQCFCIKKDSPFIIRSNFSSFLFISFHFITLNILTIFFIIINMSNNTLSAVERGARFENQVLNKLKGMNINGTPTR
jgi:hypothetical protein